MMDQSIDHVIQPDFGEARLDALQHHAFAFCLNEANAANGLVADRMEPGAPASIAAVGFAQAAYPVGVERGGIHASTRSSERRRCYGSSGSARRTRRAT